MLATVQVREGQLDSLIDDLKSDHALTRHHARESLVAIGGPDVAEALVRAMERDPDEGVRWLAADALAGLHEEGLAPVMEALEDIEPAIVVPPVAQTALKVLNEHDRR